MLKQSDRYSANQPPLVTLLEHLDVALQEVLARESMEPSQVSRTGFFSFTLGQDWLCSPWRAREKQGFLSFLTQGHKTLVLLMDKSEGRCHLYQWKVDSNVFK